MDGVIILYTYMKFLGFALFLFIFAIIYIEKIDLEGERTLFLRMCVAMN